MLKFRDLKKEEIECRNARITANGVELLLYKDARVDQNILDETVGPENWQRDHKELKGNIYCGISIWDETKKMWVIKWDAGKESYTEAEKGEASDSFKRAGFNWGIGRELYTSPFIWIKNSSCSINKKDIASREIYECKDKFAVADIKIINKEIVSLKIVNKTRGVICYVWNKQQEAKYIEDRLLGDKEVEMLKNILQSRGVKDKEIVRTLQKGYGVSKMQELTMTQYADIMRKIGGEKNE